MRTNLLIGYKKKMCQEPRIFETAYYPAASDVEAALAARARAAGKTRNEFC